MRLIDVEHLKRWIMLRWESGISVGYDDVKTNEILEQIDRELTINLEPRKKGKWIFIHPLQADDEGAYICSNCHRGDWDIKPTDKYCKFCGMAMDIYATLLP